MILARNSIIKTFWSNIYLVVYLVTTRPTCVSNVIYNQILFMNRNVKQWYSQEAKLFGQKRNKQINSNNWLK